MERFRLSGSFFATSLGATLSYVAILLFWLFLSGPLVESLAAGEGEARTLHTVKDAAFIVLTAPLLYLLIQRSRRVAQEAAAQLREEKAFIDSSLAVLPDIFYAFDEEGNILRWNKRVEEISGYTSEEIAQMHPLDFTSDKERVAEAIEMVFEDNCPVTVEAPFLTKDGEEIPYEFTGAEFTNSEGNPIGLVGTGRDITDKKQLEQEKEEISRQERAWFAQELHDGVCQQLTTLSIMTAMLRKHLQGDQEGDAKEVLERIDKMSNLTDRAVKEVRALSHGAAPVDFKEENLLKVLEELVSETEAAHRVACTFDTEDGTKVSDPTVATNLYRITQEALSNSIRHGKAEQISITLKKSKGQLILHIKDDGKGIEEQAKGGIGLQNMRRRAEVIGGALKVNSSPQDGTVVTCVVPENSRSS